MGIDIHSKLVQKEYINSALNNQPKLTKFFVNRGIGNIKLPTFFLLFIKNENLNMVKYFAKQILLNRKSIMFSQIKVYDEYQKYQNYNVVIFLLKQYNFYKKPELLKK